MTVVESTFSKEGCNCAILETRSFSFSWPTWLRCRVGDGQRACSSGPMMSRMGSVIAA